MAAGLGFKTFTTGEVLTAADTNGYLMQGILVFASSAARASAVTSPQEGQYSYLKDTNALEYYDGAAWVGAPVGDITAVTAGKGLTGGGSSGDVTVSLGTTAKGDLVAGSGTTTAAVLPVGTNGQALVADSTTATGLKWATPAGGLTLIARTSFSAVASQAFDSVFTSTYSSYLVVIDQIWAASGNAMQMQLRYAGPTTQASGYYGNNIYARANAATVTNDNTSNAAEFKINPTTGSSGLPSRGFFYISGVGNASETSDFNGLFNDGQNSYGGSFNGSASTARTYTGFLLKTASNITGTVSIYGLAKA